MILDEILESRKQQVAILKRETNAQALQRQIQKADYIHYSFKEALQAKDKNMNIIAEVKKASPSKGLICPEFDYLNIAKAYEKGGAAAISVLTEPKYFMGSNTYLSEIKKAVKLPVLRKDFIVDELQIYEARAIGADAILLIVAALTDEQLKDYLELAKSLGMDALVESHNEEEIKRALGAGAQIIGVNNRDLRNFKVDLAVSERLSHLIPKDKVFVSESGIHTREDVNRLKKAGAQAFLIGESVVKSEDPVKKLKEFIG